jgi:tetratricopeptide (TPR) repeat protein
MGTLALHCGDLIEASRRFTEALETFQQLGEPPMEAASWHQLGRVAATTNNWEEAERCYRESLKLREQINDAGGMAQTCNQLANVAIGTGRLDDAERWFLHALDGFEKTGQENHAAASAYNLAGLYLTQGRLAEAEQYAKRALTIKESLDLSAEPWKTYNILAKIAQAKGNAQEAAQWRRKEQESYFAYPGAAHQLHQWAPAFIQDVVAAIQGDTTAQSEVEESLPELEEKGWQNLVAAVRYMLAGERDFEHLRTELYYREAYIVRRILEALSG